MKVGLRKELLYLGGGSCSASFVCLLFAAAVALICFLLAAAFLAPECEHTRTTTASFQFPWQPRASFVSFFFLRFAFILFLFLVLRGCQAKVVGEIDAGVVV